jgi:hypothetical protein
MEKGRGHTQALLHVGHFRLHTEGALAWIDQPEDRTGYGQHDGH